MNTLLNNFSEKVNKSRLSGKTDTDILNFLAQKDASLSKNIQISRKTYGNNSNGISNDRDLVNYLSEKYGGQTPTVSSVPLKEQEPQKKASLLNKAGGFFGKILDTGSKLVNPTINAIQTGTMQPIREVQRLIPGGKTGEETYNTPFGKVEDVRTQSKLKSAGQAIDIASFGLPVEKVITKPISWLGKFAAGTAKRIGGTLTGKGVEVIDQIIKSPQLAKTGLSGESVDILKKLSSDIRDKTINLSQKAISDYEKALTELPKRLGRAPKVLTDKTKTTILAGGKKYVLSKQGVKSYLTEKLRNFGVKVNPTKKEFDFLESPLRKSEENILREVFNVVDKWTDTSPVGLNKLAVKIGNYRKAGDQSETLNAIVGGLKNNVRKYIGKRVPAVQELNNAFSIKEDFIDAVRKEFSIPNNLKSREGILKVARKVEQIFNSNKELTRELLQEMEQKTGINVLPIEAGRQLSSAPSRAQVSIGDSARGLIQSVIPPKFIGEIARQTGIAKQNIETALNASQPLITLLREYKPVERVAIINAILSIFDVSNRNNQE